MRSQTLNILLKFAFTPLGLELNRIKEKAYRGGARGGMMGIASFTENKRK